MTKGRYPLSLGLCFADRLPTEDICVMNNTCKDSVRLDRCELAGKAAYKKREPTSIFSTQGDNFGVLHMTLRVCLKRRVNSRVDSITVSPRKTFQ